ncbi:hypothetical protein SK128_000462, partial [Halocaridina rubra]
GQHRQNMIGRTEKAWNFAQTSEIPWTRDWNCSEGISPGTLRSSGIGTGIKQGMECHMDLRDPLE